MQWLVLAIYLDRLQAGMAAGQRTGLVEKHLLDTRQGFQGQAIPDQDPPPRRAGYTRQNGDRHSQN
ncbi:hypothetical protein D9M73_273620 [compost metagenome]